MTEQPLDGPTVLVEIEAFLARTGMSKSMFGELCRYQNIVRRLRSGNKITDAVLLRALVFMQEYQPRLNGPRTTARLSDDVDDWQTLHRIDMRNGSQMLLNAIMGATRHHHTA